MAIQEKAMLIFTDAKNNNNKFYELILHDSGNIDARWGRVGSEGQNKSYGGGKHEFDSIIRAKKAKGYEPTKTIQVNVNATPAAQSKTALAEAAKRDILGDNATNASKQSSVLIKLVDRLTEMNRHQIMVASNGNIQIDESGLITTPLGMVTATTIDEARILLTKMEKFVAKQTFGSNTYIDSLEQYLRLIPQKVPHRRGWYETFFTEHTSLISQNSFLDQLEGSIDIYKTKEQAALQQQGIIQPDKVFKTRIELVEDLDIIKKIQKYYNSTKNSSHECAHLKLKNVYTIFNDDWTANFETASKKIGNIQHYWHGTRAFNVLSIFKNGLIIPKSGGSYHITGRLFGDGLYFSDQSSKSLNYSYGFWDGGKRDHNCFMFLADVAMGKAYTPAYKGDKPYPVKGHDSVFAIGGKSGVLNNEMIVYNVGQANLKYLCEFDQ
jgi:poly [ADP-ribose] polymerase